MRVENISWDSIWNVMNQQGVVIFSRDYEIKQSPLLHSIVEIINQTAKRAFLCYHMQNFTIMILRGSPD